MRRVTRQMLPVWALAFALGAGLTAIARGESEYWRCGPGPSVEGHVVAGGYEVTSIPAGARRLKVRVEEASVGSRRMVYRLHALDIVSLPIMLPVEPGEYVSALATGKWTREDPYPPLGCPTEPLLVP